MLFLGVYESDKKNILYAKDLAVYNLQCTLYYAAYLLRLPMHMQDRVQPCTSLGMPKHSIIMRLPVFCKVF